MLSADTVDMVVELAEKCAFGGLKAACEEVLLSLPPTVKRLLQAHALTLERQYTRCLSEVTAREMICDMESLAGRPAVLKDLLQAKAAKDESYKVSSATIAPLLQDAKSLHGMVPVLQLAVRHALAKQRLGVLKSAVPVDMWQQLATEFHCDRFQRSLKKELDDILTDM
eukprot:UN2570